MKVVLFASCQSLFIHVIDRGFYFELPRILYFKPCLDLTLEDSFFFF